MTDKPDANLALGIIVIAAFCFWVGSMATKERIANDCKQIGQTRVLWNVYECAPVERKK